MLFRRRRDADLLREPPLTGTQAIAYLVLAVLGVFLVALGAALVLDVLSFRLVLASLEARPLLRVVVRAHTLLQHSGAQAVEALAGLTGLLLLACLGVRLFRLRRRPRSGHATGEGDRDAR